MRQAIKLNVRRGDKLVSVDCIVWIDEPCPEYQRGRNRKMKSRRYKAERLPHGEKDLS